MSGSGFKKLDTKYFSDAAKKAQSLANQMKEVRLQADIAVLALQNNWKGNGYDAFISKFRIYKGQLVNLEDDLFDLGEDIINAEKTYLETDMQLEKKK